MQALFDMNPDSLLSNIVATSGITGSSVHIQIVKLHNFHPNKSKIGQELIDEDTDRIVHFCKQIIELIILTFI